MAISRRLFTRCVNWKVVNKKLIPIVGAKLGDSRRSFAIYSSPLISQAVRYLARASGEGSGVDLWPRRRWCS